MIYSNLEYFNMLMCLGAANENIDEAVVLYANRFGRLIDSRVFERLIARAQNGYITPNYQNAGRRRNDNDPLIPLILAQVTPPEGDPNLSTIIIAVRLLTNHMRVYRVLRDHGFHPYHYQRVHHLIRDRDHIARVNFAGGFLAQVRRVIREQQVHFPLIQNPDISFLDYILWTDEATFTPNGVFNSKNFVYWSDRNPHLVRETNFQRQWSINIWCGLIGDQLVILFFTYYFSNAPERGVIACNSGHCWYSLFQYKNYFLDWSN